MIKIIITDDHKMICEGIKQLLELNKDISVVGMASDGNECLSMLKEKEADVLLLDINMPNKNGLDTLKEIKESKLETKVIILTVHNEADYLMRAVEIGANGYVLKDSGSAELVHAIQTVMEGDSYIQPDMIPMLNSKMMIRNKDKEKINELTKREMEVLVLVSEGMFNKEIADKLHISERTVKNHISSIFRKIDVADRTQATVFAIRNSLIHI